MLATSYQKIPGRPNQSKEFDEIHAKMGIRLYLKSSNAKASKRHLGQK